MANLQPGKLDTLLTDMAAYWREELGVDFKVDEMTLTQFEGILPAIHTARAELSTANEIQRQKADTVENKETEGLQAAVNVRKYIDIKFKKNSREYLNAPKIPRYSKKKEDAGGSGTGGSGGGGS